MRAPLKTAVASWAPLLNTIIIIVIIIIIGLTNGGHVALFKQQYIFHKFGILFTCLYFTNLITFLLFLFVFISLKHNKLQII